MNINTVWLVLAGILTSFVVMHKILTVVVAFLNAHALILLSLIVQLTTPHLDTVEPLLKDL